MLDLRNSRCYKIGEKDLVTRDNDFEMATGNSVGVMGYDSRVKIKAGSVSQIVNNIQTTSQNLFKGERKGTEMVTGQMIIITRAAFSKEEIWNGSGGGQELVGV